MHLQTKSEKKTKRWMYLVIALENTDDLVTKMARSIAGAGFVYSDACLGKYTQDPIDPAAAIFESASLPNGVIGYIGRSVPVITSATENND
ncbi:hypothetical protein INT45_004955 [Circinella minor]|uniref:Uncharacterized protein n=1 Tax=Circinella minor TaxID=1195481 RepID=A0A8H7S7A0_9FUNG|nr:hypothetical protein INT45_004955 [Circinella minor]